VQLEIEYDSYQWLILHAALNDYVQATTRSLKVVQAKKNRTEMDATFIELYEAQTKDARKLLRALDQIGRG
jgi:hypothetical protein